MVGGGPAGCAAAVFTARYGLDTLVYDRGPSSLRRCAYLENYLGFPGGIDVETFLSLAQAHVRRAGAAFAEALVTAVDATEDGFTVTTDGGDRVHTRFVVAATRHGAPYLDPLDDGDLFEEVTNEHGEDRRFDREVPDARGRTPIEGLYIVAPIGTRGDQVMSAAGQGAHVARALLEDHRIDRGYLEALAPAYDWLRPEESRAEEWSRPSRWEEWYDTQHPERREPDARLREEYVTDALSSYIDTETVATRRRGGYRALLEHIPDDVIRGYLSNTD